MQQLMGGAVQPVAAEHEDVAPVRVAQREPGVLLDHADPDAGCGDLFDLLPERALADDYAKTLAGLTVAHDMTKVTNPPGTACYTYASCLSLIKAGKKVNYQGASGGLDFNKYNNTFGPYGAFQSTLSGVEKLVFVMSANALAAATP